MQTYLDDSQEKAVRSVSGLEIWLVFLHGCSHVFFWKQKEQKKRRISKPVEDAGDCGNDHQHPLLPVQFTMEFKTSAWVHIVWIRCSLFFLVSDLVQRVCKHHIVYVVTFSRVHILVGTLDLIFRTWLLWCSLNADLYLSQSRYLH